VESINDAPAELADAIREFWPESEWDHAASIAKLESGWSAFACADTRSESNPCGSVLEVRNGITIRAEWSIGWFQINACTLPADWSPAHLYNTRHNVGTAHDMWSRRGWSPWFFSAERLGLLPT
jgi:hypothetical protein